MGDNIEHEKLRRRVKKLDSLRLIEKVSKEDIRKERELMHNAQANRGRAFLYPYLEKQTFLDIKGLVTTEEIFRYLYKCCDITNKIVDSLKKFKDERQWTMPLFDWNGIPGQHDKATIIFLDNEFHLNHSEYIKVEKIDEGQTFRIVDDKNDVTLIKLNKDKDRAFLVCSDQRQYELGVERSAGKLTICIPTGTPNESLLERFAEVYFRHFFL